MTWPRTGLPVQPAVVSLLLCAVAFACASAPPDSAKQDTSASSGGWCPERHPEAAFREISDEEGGLVVLPSKSEVKVLNPVGIRVYSLIDGTKTPEEVARAVFEEFEVDYETALSDTYAFLAELEDQGMLAQPIPDYIRKHVGLGSRSDAREAQEQSD